MLDSGASMFLPIAAYCVHTMSELLGILTNRQDKPTQITKFFSKNSTRHTTNWTPKEGNVAYFFLRGHCVVLVV